MFRVDNTLESFVLSVPVCRLTASLMDIWEIFRESQQETVVVVDEQERSRGVIHARCFLPLLVKRLSNKRPTPEHADIGLAEEETLVEPGVTLSAQMSLTEFQQYLQGQDPDPTHPLTFIVVDDQRRCLGLLDTWRLLRLWGTRRTEETSLFQQILPSVVRLLEQLPLPLMLQTAQGQTLCQNSSWLGQIGAFMPPKEINREALTVEKMTPTYVKSTTEMLEKVVGKVLESQPDCLKDSHYLAAHLSHLQLKGLVPPLSTGLEVMTSWETPATPTPSQRRSKKAAAQTPRSPLKQSERVWQFTKVPLHLADTETTLSNPEFPLWLVLGIDVTEQQRLCQELAAKNADLIQLNRLKDEFLACISHELKSPLTSVIGLSSLLKEQKLGDLNQRQARYANLIYNSGRQLMVLVNDLLDLARLETGQLKLSLGQVNIRRICQQAHALIAAKYEEKVDHLLEFSLEIESGLDSCEADPLRLQQMLVHLLDNAVKFTQTDGKMGLKVACWEKWVTFTVWDTGIGIPEEAQHLIFQKFQQLESPLTRRFEGTGLGLVLTQRLARAHGGEISFISKEGQGSQFTLLLPRSEVSGEGLSLANAGGSGSKPGNQLVLIVEAVSEYIDDLTGHLQTLGYRFVIARTGTEALEKARQLQPLTILLNPMLSLLSGWDVLTLLKTDERTRKIPVIMMAVQSERQQAESHGAYGFLPLPIDGSALRKILHECAQSRTGKGRSLTILHLHPDLGQTSWIASLINACNAELSASGFNYRVLEADALEQADIIARVWHIHVIIIDGTALYAPLAYLRSLKEQECLASLPIVTLDAKTTEAANQVEGLSIFPCLTPIEEQNIESLLQVLHIAAGNAG